MRNERSRKTGSARGDSRKRPAAARPPFRKTEEKEVRPRGRSLGENKERSFPKSSEFRGEERKSRSAAADKKSFGDRPYERRKDGKSSFSKKGKFKKKDGRVQKRDAFFEKQRKDKLSPEAGGNKKRFTEKDKKGTGYPRTEKRKRISGSDSEKREGRAYVKKDFSTGRFSNKEGDKGAPRQRPERFGSERTRDKESRPWNRKEDHRFYGDKKKAKAPLPKTHDDGSVRLNKYIANAGICSRREADELIAAGVVSVNGNVITEMGYKVMPGDSVKYNNELLRSEQLVYILLNKPKDFITTTDDPENRKTVMSLIARAGKERVYPVGRLDRNTTGVLLFTNDGDLAKKLTHPSFEVQKIYQVELDRALKGADMQQIADGIKLDDGFIKADEIVYTSTDKNVIGLELHSGKNRIVRRIFEHLGYEVRKLDRVIFAGLTKKDLPRGRWRFLSEMEVANLKMMTGRKSVKVS
jgi:23S rRNA pseudouridine2605 synthase